MDADADRFLERFRAFGAQPSVANYLALFDPDATLFDSGMERPITVPEIPEHIEGILKLVPDFRMTPERWRLRDGTIFVEAHNQASLRDRLVEWPSVYCISLRGDRVIRGRRYYDRRPLVSLVFAGIPSEPPFEFVVSAAPIAAAPCSAADFVRGRSVADSPHFACELLDWAGDEALIFIEWRVREVAGGRSIDFGATERFDLEAGRVSRSHCYFDTLALSPR